MQAGSFSLYRSALLHALAHTRASLSIHEFIEIIPVAGQRSFIPPTRNARTANTLGNEGLTRTANVNSFGSPYETRDPPLADFPVRLIKSYTPTHLHPYNHLIPCYGKRTYINPPCHGSVISPWRNGKRKIPYFARRNLRTFAITTLKGDNRRRAIARMLCYRQVNRIEIKSRVPKKV